MKELLVIVGVTALGAGVGLYLRDQPSAAALPAPPAMQITTTADLERPVKPPPRRPAGYVEETVLADGTKQVTHYNSDGSKGMRINYGPERAGTMPSGNAPPYRATTTTGGGGSPAPRPAARC